MVSVMKNCESVEGRFFLDSEHHNEWLPPCPLAFSSCVGTRLKRTVVHYSSGVSGNKCRLTERRTWFFHPECFSEVATKPSQCVKPREKD